MASIEEVNGTLEILVNVTARVRSYLYHLLAQNLELITELSCASFSSSVKWDYPYLPYRAVLRNK